jgi:hypothetical protein
LAGVVDGDISHGVRALPCVGDPDAGIGQAQNPHSLVELSLEICLVGISLDKTSPILKGRGVQFVNKIIFFYL